MRIGFPTLHAVGAVRHVLETKPGPDPWKAIGGTGCKIPTFSPHSRLIADRSIPRKFVGDPAKIVTSGWRSKK